MLTGRFLGQLRFVCWGCAAWRTRVLRPIKRILGLLALCLAASVTTGGDAFAQSFFEKLFGLGDPRPLRPAARDTRRVTPAARQDVQQSRPYEPRSHHEDQAGGGDMLQTMCVRTCDGYYWPVRFPVPRRESQQDASVCASTCGAQAKLYTRSGPGVDAEEMKDADGVSYGASATAFAYRKGLVNGCACRPMPWSDGEQARHEGYGLAEAEKAIRAAQAEAERAAAASAAEVATVEVKPEPAEVHVAAVTVPAPGPAEAAAIAAFGETAGNEPSVEVAVAAPEKPVRGTSKRKVRGVRHVPGNGIAIASGSEPHSRRRNTQYASSMGQRRMRTE